MGWLQASLVVYGLLNIVLGALAFSKSPISLYAGGGAGLVILICAWLAKTQPKVAYVVAAIVCVALIVRFGQTLMREFQLYPGFVVFAASAIMLLLLIVGHFAARSQSA